MIEVQPASRSGSRNRENIFFFILMPVSISTMRSPTQAVFNAGQTYLKSRFARHSLLPLFHTLVEERTGERRPLIFP